MSSTEVGLPVPPVPPNNTTLSSLIGNLAGDTPLFLFFSINPTMLVEEEEGVIVVVVVADDDDGDEVGGGETKLRMRSIMTWY